MHGANIIGTFSLLCAGSGVWLSATAHRYPNFESRIEYVAGVMLIGGLALLGACLKWVVE